MRIQVLLILLSLALTSFGQSIDVEEVKMIGVDKLSIKSVDGCCSKKGYRAIYYFDKEGNAIKSMNYFKRKHLASFVYKYGVNGLLVEEIQTYDINNKDRIDTTRYNYSYDSNNRVISKTAYFGGWEVDKKYEDFDSNNNAETVRKTVNNLRTVTKRKFDAQNRIVHLRRFENDTLYFEEEIRYNAFNDIVFSKIPTLLDQETSGMLTLIGGNRHAETETFEYKYDHNNRWAKKYVIFDNKKVLLEKRAYKSSLNKP